MMNISYTGTGKSVTGAHIAYALAMRLCKEQTQERADTMCVMYCGPSQQSVNVVVGKSIREPCIHFSYHKIPCRQIY